MKFYKDYGDFKVEENNPEQFIRSHLPGISEEEIEVILENLQAERTCIRGVFCNLVAY